MNYRLTIDFTSDNPVTTWDVPYRAPTFIALALEDMDNVMAFKLERIEGGEAIVTPDCELVTVWSIADQTSLVTP